MDKHEKKNYNYENIQWKGSKKNDLTVFGSLIIPWGGS
jgi:hypothetical protein